MQWLVLLLSMMPGMMSSGETEYPPLRDPSLRLALKGEVYSTNPRGQLRIMWYNVENLFHPDNDSIPGDDEFTPGGLRHWTHDRYGKKLTSLAKVIIAAGAWDPPDLVGLCEVENTRILETLVKHPLLISFGYRFVHQDSPDRRGMDVACLYREKRIRLSAWNTCPSVVRMPAGGTRDLLHFCGVWGKQDTLDLFLVHLISKYSGAGATAEPRRRQVGQLLELADSVKQLRKTGLMVLAGDFNGEMGEYSMEPLRNATVGGDSIMPVKMNGPGSYKYRGRWSRIDQFLVCDQVHPYRIGASILNLPALLTRDEIYGGVKPDRTYEGYVYNGGISDHLPILLDITVRSFSIRSER